MKSCVRGGYLSGVVVVVGDVVVAGDVELHERWLGSLLHVPLTGPQRSGSFPYLASKMNYYMLLL
jgi:hypothetical protein